MLIDISDDQVVVNGVVVAVITTQKNHINTTITLVKDKTKTVTCHFIPTHLQILQHIIILSGGKI